MNNLIHSAAKSARRIDSRLKPGAGAPLGFALFLRPNYARFMVGAGWEAFSSLPFFPGIHGLSTRLASATLFCFSGGGLLIRNGEDRHEY